MFFPCLAFRIGIYRSRWKHMPPSKGCRARSAQVFFEFQNPLTEDLIPFLVLFKDAHLQGHSQDMAIIPVTVVNSCRNIIQKWSNCLFANLLSMNLGVHEQWIFFRPGSCGRNHNMLTLHDRACFILYAWVYCTVDDDFSEFRTKFWLWMGRLPLKILWTGLF